MISTLAAALALLLAAGAAPASGAGYTLRSSIALTPETDGFRGRLELLTDHRLTAAIDSLEWNTAAFDRCDEPDSIVAALCKQTAREPLRLALVRVADSTGRVIQTVTLRSVLARVQPCAPYGTARRLYLVTEDLSAVAGGGNGPVTKTMEMGAGKLSLVYARHASGAAREPIEFVDALRAGWQIVSASGGRREFLYWESENGSARRQCGDDFATTFSRFRPVGMTWFVTSRVECGITEAEDESPPLAKFPAEKARAGR
jgi:hypothetical protein